MEFNPHRLSNDFKAIMNYNFFVFPINYLFVTMTRHKASSRETIRSLGGNFDQNLYKYWTIEEAENHLQNVVYYSKDLPNDTVFIIILELMNNEKLKLFITLDQVQQWDHLLVNQKVIHHVAANKVFNWIYNGVKFKFNTLPRDLGRYIISQIDNTEMEKVNYKEVNRLYHEDSFIIPDHEKMVQVTTRTLNYGNGKFYRLGDKIVVIDPRTVEPFKLSPPGLNGGYLRKIHPYTARIALADSLSSKKYEVYSIYDVFHELSG